MNIARDAYERHVLAAFSAGMNAGYGIEHTNIEEEEKVAIEKYAEQQGFKRKSAN